MLYINENQAKDAIGMASILPVIRLAYIKYAQGELKIGPRLVMDVDPVGINKGQWLTATYQDYFGSKFSAVFPKNPASGLPATISTISLYSSQTGESIAIIAADALTAIKTAASAAVATDILARKDASCLVVIGSGLQAFHQVLAICQVRAITEVIVYDLNITRAQNFIESLKGSETWNTVINATIAESANAAATQADILCTCTTSRKPVFDGGVLRPGTHINAIGSYAPDMQEIDAGTVARASCIITEHVDGLWAAAGDILAPYAEGLIDRNKITGSIGDVLTGIVKPEISTDSITLYESVGSAALDLAVAIEVYAQMVKKSPSCIL